MATSFTPLAPQQLALPLQLQSGQTLAVLDVDGDGHLDLLAGNTVAYGKGDGTFGNVAVLPALATGYNQTYAVDIDGDGKLDIVAVDTPPAVSAPGTVQYAFTVFHNAGGGNFTRDGTVSAGPLVRGGLEHVLQHLWTELCGRERRWTHRCALAEQCCAGGKRRYRELS